MAKISAGNALKGENVTHKKPRREKKSMRIIFWKSFARKVLQILNMLPHGEHYIVNHENDNEFSLQTVRESIWEWESATKCSLDRLLNGLRKETAMKDLFISDPDQPLLPSKREMERMVKQRASVYEKDIYSYDTPEAFYKLRNYILISEFEMLHADFKNRVIQFKEYLGRIRVCTAFLNEVRELQSNMKTLETLVPVQESDKRQLMEEYLEGVFSFWEVFCYEKSVDNLMIFYNNIREHKKIINILLNQLYPEYGTLEYRGLPYVIAGARMSQALQIMKAPCSMQRVA
ncbi:MAG: hypothetical protein PHT88_00125 [Candidatus Moranbacteria bacterium]|nr:hypothetical protein [Candidatus Moranbacteria bacterium]